MSTGEDEPSSGLSGRLRPRKSAIHNPQTTKTIRKPDSKPTQDKPKRTTTPSKSPNKLDDLTDKSDSPLSQILCPYCDRSFFSKQAVSKHIRRFHILTSKQDNVINCLFCNHSENDANDIIRHMVDNHPNQYFACCDCHTRFPSTTELAEHKLNVCEKQKLPYRNKLRPKTTQKKDENVQNINEDFENEDKNNSEHGFNGIVISCELKPSHPSDPIDIENNITTNLILPSSKSLGNVNVIEKNAIIVLDDLQWNKRIPSNFSFHNTDADQILSRLGVVHRSPRTGENNKKDWYKHIDDTNQKFEKCFDTSFYSKVASNVQENLTKFLDGTFNFNPDPENTIKTRKSKNSVVINTVEGFPFLLAAEQFSRNVFDGYLPRTIAPKHKWKWENIENDKNFMSPEQIKRDCHTNNCIITLVSSLDIWTQLCMRHKFEEKFSASPIEKRFEKQSILGKELKEILESRELPTSSTQIVNYTPTFQDRDTSDFPASLGLVPNPPNFDLKPAVLSGEWVRPRCYVCCACGAQTRDSKALSSHISTQHPNAQIQHYEIVGEVLLNSDILKHLYVPPSQLNNRTRPLRGFRECTKCRKSISLEDLHQHMLDCAGDTPMVRRKCRYRPFGVRKRRPRLPDNTIRKEMRKDIRHQRHNRKTHMRPRPKIRTEVGDAETIRKMLADLPAKRHRAMVNPLNPILRPRRKLTKQRTKLVIKKRAIDEMIRKPSGDIPKENDLNKKSGSEKCDGKVIHSVKRVASKILSHKSCLNKKIPINKNRRKIFMTKVPEANTDSSEVSAQPLEGETNIETNEMSNENNSQRVNLNDGSYNKREHGNTQKGSNNREGQDPGSSGQNNNSRDSFAPSQQVPLKHSIASLTASSETHDKSVQFHHLFLVQQECNNTTQHSPSGQRMFFENEAVVTKLDKPPLHFNHSEVLDPQMFQRNKLNKPRKGLNDCIAMLKNKLVEPNSSILPGHVSVQCGTDEPLGPEPIMIERRHSTTDSNIDSAQRSLQMFYPDKTVEDSLQSYDMKNCVTRRSNTRHGQSSRREKIMDVQPINDYLYWNQFYYNKLMMPLNNSSYKYNRRESTRRRSVISAEELLLQQAMNLELLANGNRNLNNFTEYQSTNTSTPQKSTSKNRQDGYKMRSNSNNSITKPKNKETSMTHQKNSTDLDDFHKNHQQKIPEIGMETIKTTKDKPHENYPGNNAVSAKENVDDCYVQNQKEDKSIDHNSEKTMLLSNNKPEDRLCSNICSNVSMLQYSKNPDLIPVHYNMHLNTTLTVPLDLSNKTSNVEESRHYPSEEPYCAKTYDRYKNLDCSGKNLNNVSEKETYINNDDVDLRFNNTSQVKLSRSTHFPSKLKNNLEDNAPNISFGHSSRRISESDECLPRDFSTKGKDASLDSYEKRRLCESPVEDNMIQNLSRPLRHVQDISMIVPRRKDLDNEEPTDLSNKRAETKSKNLAICASDEQQIRLNVCANNPDRNDEEIPADLLSKNKSTLHDNYYRNEQRMPQYVEAEVLNNNGGPIIEGTNQQLSLNSINSEQHMNTHYNLTAPIPRQSNALDSRSLVPFTEPTLGRSQNISSPQTISTSSVPYDLPISINRSPISESGVRNDVPYLIAEMPLSLYAKKADEANCCNSLCHESRSRASEYENAMSAYMLAQYRGMEPSNIHTDGNTEVYTSTAYTLDGPATEVVMGHKSNASSIVDKSNHIDKRRLSYDSEIIEGKKYSSNEENLHTYRLDTENRNLETVKQKNNQTREDQDPETARKIAMLPKELVEILGTMPIDHRNQLLNVLPQYVSSSTSPVLLSHNTESFRRDSVSLSVNSVSPKLTRNSSENDYMTGLTLENRHPLPNHTSSSQISRFVEITPITVSSSILLTPPTPQLSDRHFNQSHDNYELKSIDYRRKSRISIEDQTPTKNSENISTDSHLSVVKRLTVDECESQDRIIDLTGDEFSPETPDVSHNYESFTQSAVQSSKDMSSLIFTPKSNALKTNSDKTASLRAVRIKTSSERQRSVLAENTLIKKHIDNSAHLIEEEPKNSIDATDLTMAIQQAEISSTQQKPIIRTSSILLSKTDLSMEEGPTNSLPSIDKMTVSTIIDDNCRKHEKQNVVTSSRSKGTHLNSTDEVEIDSVYRIHTNATFSKKTDNESFLSPDKPDVSSKDKIVTEHESLVSSDSTLQLAIEDDDSEDDVTLAVIVKQKNRDLKIAHDDTTVYEEKNSSSKKDKKSELMSSDKPSLAEQNQVSLSSNNLLQTDTSPSESQSLKKSIEICNDTNVSEYSESQTKEKVPYPKKKGRKGRRVNILDTTKYVEEQAHLHNLDKTDSESEVHKENNRFADDAKNVQVTDDTFETKSIEPDSDQPTSTSIVVTNENDDISNARIEKANAIPYLSIECQASGDMNLNSRNSGDTAVKKIIQDTVKEYSHKNRPFGSNSVDNAANTKTCENTSCKDLQNIENNGKSHLLESSDKIIETQVNDDRKQGDLHKTKEANDIQSNLKLVEKCSDNKLMINVEEINLTPLRRSRRGKSLFIDSNTIITSENTPNTENPIEQKAPLTKKQLIFSKLLQDEENHKKPILTITHDKQITEPISNIENENKQDNQSNNEFNEDHSNEVKTNKRKKSPQSKRKCKKKKSLSFETADEEKEDTVEQVTKELNNQETTNLAPDNMLSNLQVTSQLKSNDLNTEKINTPIDSTDDCVNIECSTKQSTPTEKRKSATPDKDDLLSIPQQKKSKLNEKTQVSIKDNKDINTCKKIVKVKETKDAPATVSSRITTCYNKATKRARSKSVVVKSSGSEMYDPYDIDLEDMADKTEPFVRNAITPKISFNTFKSTMLAKTKKLGKTLSSAIIDILPSDTTSSAAGAGSEHLIADKINNTANSNNNSVINTKDGNTDSDESTKSDVPLKKLVEEKEKKLTETNSTSVPESMEKSENITSLETCIKSRQKSKPRKKNRQTECIHDSEPKNNNNKTENEEELRSEQFMESFGFFSERKPRKSNLLATKKISETFNLIENDDAYFTSKERVTKKSANDNRKEDEAKTKSVVSNPKKLTKRGRKKNRRVKTKPSFCNLCQRAFRRWDNYVRHLLSLYHISRLCEIELKVKTVLITEEPNYLLAYRQQLNRLKVLQNKIAKRKMNCLSTADIILPTLEEILADVKRTIREQQISRLGLSRDEALFIDCCEMLKESHPNDISLLNKGIRHCDSFDCNMTCQEEFVLLGKNIRNNRCDVKTDGEMDSVTAKKIMESEEVRNLEKDLISNLKEANGLKGPLTSVQIEASENFTETITESHTVIAKYEVIKESTRPKYKRQGEIKNKLYPDVVDNIDMFEDKFDKIKRKCRSQAAAAKQLQTHVDINTGNKRKKSEKKKVKISSRKGQNAVPTKAALKGFDGVKVSILTSDINISAIVPSVEKPHKKKKKSSSKKKRDRKNSEKSNYENDHCNKESSQKKVDVYEFMDTEDTEVFEFRPSTLMERFKSINNKELPSTSKSINENEIAEISSESGSDGDDFVYMSDDYVCSEDETENSVLSCELGNGKGTNEYKKSLSPPKRKEVTEKSAVMGKIFKHNAVRTERKNPKNKELAKPKANLDQLFDSLLEKEPNHSKLTKDTVSPERDEFPTSRVYLSLSPQKDEFNQSRHLNKRSDQGLSLASETGLTQKYSTPSPTLHPSLSSFSSRRKSITPPRKLELSINSVSTLEQESTIFKRKDDYKKYETTKELDTSKETHSKKYDTSKEIHSKNDEPVLSSNVNNTRCNLDETLRRQSDDFTYEKDKSREKFSKDKSEKRNKDRSKYDNYEFSSEFFEQTTPEDAGVARQRARRKCTVGKQNVLAETWSSESEPDALPPRPNSVESVVASSGRKKRGRKKDGQSSSNRKANKPVSTKKYEYESRVGSSHRSVGSGGSVRPRSSSYYWSEGDDEQEHPQQHGWIVGDSHKKLVTMLAHAKGRKRSGDEKRDLLE